MNLALGPAGDFALTLPSGRILFVPNTQFASAFLFRILWDAEHGGEAKGYIGKFPTQAIVDTWASAAIRKAEQDAWLKEAAAKRLAEFGLEINL